jgi:hypothetical protein
MIRISRARGKSWTGSTGLVIDIVNNEKVKYSPIVRNPCTEGDLRKDPQKLRGTWLRSDVNVEVYPFIKQRKGSGTRSKGYITS